MPKISINTKGMASVKIEINENGEITVETTPNAPTIPLKPKPGYWDKVRANYPAYDLDKHYSRYIDETDSFYE
jgi:hypothetical protein